MDLTRGVTSTGKSRQVTIKENVRNRIHSILAVSQLLDIMLLAIIIWIGIMLQAQNWEYGYVVLSTEMVQTPGKDSLNR